MSPVKRVIAKHVIAQKQANVLITNVEIMLKKKRSRRNKIV
ncbi:MAG: hypothetical protein ACKN9V_04615 [Pseudomonadota bacterium]